MLTHTMVIMAEFGVPVHPDARYHAMDEDGDWVAWVPNADGTARWYTFDDVEWYRCETPILAGTDLDEIAVIRQQVRDAARVVAEPAAAPYVTAQSKGTVNGNVRTLTLAGADKPAARKIPRNAIATWQGLDDEGDTVALLPSGQWMVWDHGWHKCHVPTFPHKMVVCKCIRYGCSRCDLVQEVRE